MSEPTICYTVAGVMQALGVSRPTVQKLIDHGVLRTFRIGTHIRIPVADVHALVGYEPPADAADAAEADESSEVVELAAGGPNGAA